MKGEDTFLEKKLSFMLDAAMTLTLFEKWDARDTKYGFFSKKVSSSFILHEMGNDEVSI
jgi:hypothetical protein